MSELDANADLLKRQREIISRQDLKPFTKRRNVPGLLYFFGLLGCIGASGYLVYIAEPHGWWIWPAIFILDSPKSNRFLYFRLLAVYSY